MMLKGKIKKLSGRLVYISYRENGKNREISVSKNALVIEDLTYIISGKAEVEFTLGKGKDGRPLVKDIKVIRTKDVAKKSSDDVLGQSSKHTGKTYNRGKVGAAVNSQETTSTHSDRPRSTKQSAMDCREHGGTMPECYLPSDTMKVVNRFDIDNIALRINKAAYYEQDRNNSRFVYRFDPKGKDFKIGSEKFAKVPLQKIIKKQAEAVKAMKLVSESINLTLDWRLAVGLGGASVYETSMTLHHVYGVPYLPGSAVKGLVRSRVIAECFDGEEGGRSKGALADKEFCLLFGSPTDSVLGVHRGIVCFFDVFPFTAPVITKDLMNPHYGPYYAGEKPPVDYHNPVPVTFLTVENTGFTFVLGIREKDNKPIDGGFLNGKTPLEIAKHWLELALKEHGIGAKTSVGYGLFV